MRAALLVLIALGVPRPAEAQALAPPRVLQNPPALYPAQHSESATVALVVTVSAAGEVETVEVAESGGPDFDRAATAAVKQWHFAPATRDGAPFAARIRIPFVFAPPNPPDAGPSAMTAAADGGAAPPVVSAMPGPPEVLDAGAPESIEEVSVRGQLRKAQHGGSDFQIELGQLAQNVQNSKGASAILQLAPGIFIANEGGQGHADQVFLRGFNAEQGQSIEFSVGGVPINDVDNPDGHGYADTHFIIPELVKNLRVIEGPFDPRQGDFAVAGSAEYELGVAERGLRLESWFGSDDTRRLLALWAPREQRDGTFAAAQFWSSAGFGENRANTNASAMAQYEGELGLRGLWRVLATSYAAHYRDAGVLRREDVNAGKVDFFGSEDPSLGGDATRHSLSFDLQNPFGRGTVSQQLFLTLRTDRIQENFTGFLLDPLVAGQSEHGQRGDGIQQHFAAVNPGARGSYRLTTRVLGREQALEAGYFARYDHVTSQVERVRFGTNIPYRVDEDLVTDVFNLAGYVDADLHPTSWLSLRGGLRQELFNYGVDDQCATAGFVVRNGPADVQCPSRDRAGSRLPRERVTATGELLEPKLTATAQLLPALALTASYGVGAQSLGPTGLAQDENAPFALLKASEAGALVHQRFAALDLSGRAVGFSTHVDRDLVFNPAEGRLTASSGTTRRGAVASVRATGRWFDELASVTYAHASFDEDHALVPYVPSVVARSDSSVFGRVPRLRLLDRPVHARAGLGVELLGERALPLGQSSSPTATADLSASVRYSVVQAGLKIDNLTDARYPLSTFFYASDFHSRPYPTLAPTEHFTAAPPRMVMFTLTVFLDGAEGS